MKQTIQSTHAPKAIGPYSQAVSIGDFVFTSGQLGIDLQTGTLAQGVEAQAKLAMTHIGSILKEKGLTHANIIKTTIFLTDMADFKAVNAVYQSFFTADFPARSTVQVAALPLGGSVEIECIATA